MKDKNSNPFEMLMDKVVISENIVPISKESEIKSGTFKITYFALV